MSNAIFSSKPKLSADWIDASAGEAHIIRKKLHEVFPTDPYTQWNTDWNYPPSNGYEPLVKLLEEKYQAPVIITNGAKNALGAVFYALKQLGYSKLGLRTPHWCLLPPLIQQHGLETRLLPDINDHQDIDSLLCVSPDNPTNHIAELPIQAGLAGKPVIHDAVYALPIYCPDDYHFTQFGDVQIYSASKSFGFSSLRIGYCVVSNPNFYALIQQYMEMMTVGVSMPSQIFLYDLLKEMNKHPFRVKEFEQSAKEALRNAKRIIKQVSSDVLQVPEDFENSNGMFGFFPVGAKANFEKAKIYVLDGTPFGKDGYVRMNLAFDEDTMEEIVRRLNENQGD